MKFRTLLFSVALLPFSASWGQQAVVPCLANDLTHVKPLHEFTQEELDAMTDADAELEAFTQQFVQGWSEAERSDYIIPVVFHIIHDNGPENISDEQIYDAMRVLNEDFNRQNADWDNVRPEFQNIVADVGIEFRLARKDPNGNCTKGITRTQSPLTNDGTQTMKNLIQWPRNRYLNVWVAASANGAAGYTYRPNAVNNNPSWDGIVLQHSYTGSIGTSSPSRSRTLTHEVGHWINLAHTWGNSNEPTLSENCNDDDSVSDTPNTIGWTTCFLSGTSCGSLDNVENYMEYSYCSKMFTNGQAARMIAALNAGTAQRNQLHTASNLDLTGVVEGFEPLCQAVFNSEPREVCQGSVLQFTDASFHGVTSRTWEFPGGTPSTSNAPDPVVTYSVPGTYSVSLTVSDGNTSLTSTSENIITVLAEPGVPMPFDEGFEAYGNLDDSPWSVKNINGNNTFHLTNATAHSGVNSVRILNTTAMAGQTDDLISNTMDLSGESSIQVSYRYAYAQRSSANDDRLRVYVSNDCGATWSMRQQLRGTNTLNTGGIVGGSFVPTGQQWSYSEVTNISDGYLTDNFRVRFEFQSDGGNNVYIDDININGSPVGVEEAIGGGEPLSVVPNPATDAAQVVFILEGNAQVRLELMDVLGRSLQLLHDGGMAAGTHRLDLPVAGLQAGLYFVRLRQGIDTRVVRFVVK